MGGHTSPALTGPPEAGGRLIRGAGAVAPAGRPKADLWPMFPHWGKLFSEKVPKNLECPLWDQKPKLFAPKFCTFLVPKPSRGDLYLTISRFSGISPIFPQTLQIWPSGQAFGLGSQGCLPDPTRCQVRFLVYVQT